MVHVHLLHLNQLVIDNPTLSVTIGQDYLIKPDVVIGLEDVPTVNGLPLLHAAVLTVVGHEGPLPGRPTARVISGFQLSCQVNSHGFLKQGTRTRRGWRKLLTSIGGHGVHDRSGRLPCGRTNRDRARASAGGCEG